MRDNDQNRVRILLVEDNPGDFRLIQEMLAEDQKNSFVMERTQRLDQSTRILKSGEFDLILLDLGLPDSQGIDTFRTIQQEKPEVPIVILSGLDDEKTALDAMKKGAQDYLIKGQINPALLSRSIRYAIERRKAEEALSKNELKYRTIANYTHDWEYWVDQTGAFIYVSPSCKRITGYSHDAFLKDPAFLEKIVFPGDLHLFKAHERESKSGNMEGEVDFRIIHKEGGIRWIGHVCRLVFDNEGRPLGRRASNRDITLRKKMEEEILAREKEAQRLARQNEIMAEIGQIITATPEIEKIYEKFAQKAHFLIPFDRIAINIVNYADRRIKVLYFWGEEVAGANSGSVFHLGDSTLSVIEKMSSAVVLQGEMLEAGIKAVPSLRRNVESGFRSLLFAPMIFQNSVFGFLGFSSREENLYKEEDRVLAERVSFQIAGAIANSQLYKEHQRMESDLKKSEERYRSLVELSPLMILLHRQKKYIYVNPAAVKALGASSKEELIGKTIYEIVHPDYWEVINDRFERLNRGEQIPVIEEKFVRLDKKIIDVEVTFVHIFYENDDVIMVVARDITEAKKAEQEKNLLQAQLLQAQKMEAIGQLAGGFAHDFNNSLTLVNVCSQLLLMDMPENNPYREKVGMIHEATQRSANLARQLLAFSRRQVMEMKVIDLNIILQDLSKMLKRVIGEDIEMIQILGENLGMVMADPGQIEQVVLNIVLNARDAMPEGGRLLIETANVELDEVYARNHVSVKPGPHVLLAISDSGIGMTPEIKGRIFEPFFTTKDKDRGTGLGLSMVYGIVKQTGGNIWAYSEPGMGTTFKIYLPRVNAQQETNLEHVAALDIPKGGETILVAEDEKEVRRITVEILSKNGYRILAAENGHEALLAAENEKSPIHLLVTDLVMPRMRGAELAKRLQSIRPELKVLFMSGYSDYMLFRNGFLEPGVHFIQKPFSYEGLLKKVREVLDLPKEN